MVLSFNGRTWGYGPQNDEFDSLQDHYKKVLNKNGQVLEWLKRSVCKTDNKTRQFESDLGLKKYGRYISVG